MPALKGSVTPSAAAVATAASVALPPARSTRSPTRVAYGSTDVTAPPEPYAVARLGGSAGRGPAGAVASDGAETVPRVTVTDSAAREAVQRAAKVRMDQLPRSGCSLSRARSGGR